MPLETEIKIPIPDPAALRPRLQAAGFRPGARRREMNWLLDNPARGLARAGLLLRLRRRGGQWLLTAKGPRRRSRRLKIRPEIEMLLPEGRQLLAILALVRLRPSLIYQRDRTLWRARQFPRLIAAWDHTPIGDYLELEGPAAQIRAAARRLGFPPAAASTASYPDLFRAWARRQHHPGQEFTFAALRHKTPPARRPARRR